MKRLSFLSRLATSLAAVALTLGTGSMVTSCSEDDTTEEPTIVKLTAPAAPAVGEAGDDVLSFSWQGVAKASGYTAQVYLNKLGAPIRETITELTAVTFTGLADNTTYFFRVRANDPTSEMRNSVWTEWIESATNEIPSQYTPLDTPKDPVCDASKTIATSLSFTWEPVERAASYTYKLVNEGSEADRTAVVEGTSVTITGLSQGATYSFAVKANPTEGSTQYRASAYSKSVKTMTVSTLATPSKPENTLCMAEALAFSWGEVPNAASYAYELFEGNGTEPVAVGFASSKPALAVRSDAGSILTETTNTTASFAGLKRDTYYSFRIQAVPAEGASYLASSFTDYTITKTRLTDATPLAAPQGVAAPAATLKPISAVVSWGAVAGAGSYKYQWGVTQAEAEVSESVEVVAVEGVLPTQFAKAALTSEATYVVRVMACAAEGDAAHSDSDWSAWVTVTTPALLDAIEVATAAELLDAFASLKDGGVVTLKAGSYELAEAAVISKAVTIKAASGVKAIIKAEKAWEMASGAAISKLEFDGVTIQAAGTLQYLFNIGASVPFTLGTFSVKNCEILGFERSIFRQQATNDTQLVGAIAFDNCKIMEGPVTGQSYAIVQFSTTLAKAVPATVSFTNSTLCVQNVVNISKVGAADGVNTTTVTVDKCTLYNVGYQVGGKNMFDMGKGGSTLAVTNSIMGKSAVAKDVNGTAVTKTISGYYYTSDHGVTSLQMASNVTILTEDSAAIFTDAAAGDLSFKSSSANYETLNGKVGDPRWWK